MKKIISLALVLLLLAACAAPAVDEPATTEYITTTEQPTTTEEPTTAEPREWPGVPQAYWAILDNPTQYPSRASGFALVDINNDGVLELVMISRWTTGNVLVGLYTQRDGEAYRLAVGGGGRFGFEIAADGTVFHGSGGMGHNFFGSWRLEPHAVEPTQLTRISTVAHWDDDTQSSTFTYENLQGERGEITKEAHEAMMQRYAYPANPMQFNITWFDEVAA